MAHAQTPKFTLYALPALLVALFILAACGGGGATPEGTAVDCTEALFDSPDTCKAEKNTFCAMEANLFNEMCISGGLGGDERNTFCILPANVFANTQCMDLGNIADLRDAFCLMPANIFIHAECRNLSNINDLRMTFCTTTDIFHLTCLTGDHGGKDERDKACQMHGITAPNGHSSCDGGISDIRGACVTNPFIYRGCDTLDTLDDKIRRDFCAKPAELFNPTCITRSIGDHDGDRDIACQTHGTGAMGHASCDGRIRTACTANPFMYEGCKTLDDFETTLRPDFCGNTAVDTGKNPFHPMCPVNDGDRKTACLLHGTAASLTECDGIIRMDCVAKPFDNPGCRTLSDIDDLDDDFCEDTAADTGSNPFHGMCPVNNGDRETACLAHGINADALCDGIIRNNCITNPFDTPGCRTLSDIDDLDDRFCGNTAVNMGQNPFHGMCPDVEGDRNAACRAFGVAANGTCANRPNIRSVCDMDEFTQTTGLSPNKNLCTGTDTDGGKKYGDIRRDNCLNDDKGVLADPSCATNPDVITACEADPFTQTGCENLGIIISIKEGYCGTSANAVIDRCTVEYTDWAASFGTADKAPPTTPNATRRNQFLNAGDDALASAINEVFEPEDGEAATTLHLGALNGGDATDGVSYFTLLDSGDNTKRYYYAGLDSRTDLGAPSFQETGTAIWNGKFGVTIGTTETSSDFELEVTFGGGSGDVAGSIEAFVVSGGEHFLLKGDYDESGVISGTVNYGAFMAGTRTPMTTRADNGILTGLIGRQGAIGAFLSGTGLKDNITGGTSTTTGFVGGFVASPFEGNVSYNDWVGIAAPATIATGATLPNPVINQFLTTTRNSLDKGDYTGAEVNVNLATATYEDVALGGSVANGFNTHVIGTDNYLVGISSTTSLSAPITQATGTGAWKGSFVVYEGGVATITDFELMIAFATSKLSATINPSANIEYSFTNVDINSGGDFRGGITRDVGTQKSGNISGIIGQKGAVGVFISDTGPGVSFAGGFVAVPEPCVLAGNCVANHAAWVASFGASPPPATRVAANVGTAAFGGFLNLADGVRDISGAGLSALNTNTHLTLDGNNGDGMHGVTYLVGRNDMLRDQVFVAVLPTTNLGAPLVAQPTAAWPGTYYNNFFAREQPVVFNIAFDANTINATHNATTPFPLITTFALIFNPTTGVITGTVNNGGSATATARGLIGTNGLVGVFVDETPSQAPSTSILYGGFIADNPDN